MSAQMVTRVLIVDDEADTEPLFRQGLRHELKAGAIEIAFASGAETALGLIEADEDPPFDTIISDLNMPGMNGFDLLTRIVERRPHVSLAAVSANADQRTQERVERLGALAFFAKPVDFDAIRAFLSAR